AVWLDSTDVAMVGMGYTAPGQVTAGGSGTFTFSGSPPGGTFSDADADAGPTARISVTSGSASRAAAAPGSGPSPRGVTLVLTGLKVTRELDDRWIYAFSGTLDATLSPAPQTSATGNVALHASF